MAEKSASLILDALSRALSEPMGAPLFAAKGEQGLFPNTLAVAKNAAQRCKDEGWLQSIRSETRGKIVREVCILTEKGMTHLMQQANPRRLLEDFVRVLEARQDQVGTLLATAQAMQTSLQALHGAANQILPRLQAAEPITPRVRTALETAAHESIAHSHDPGDSPMTVVTDSPQIDVAAETEAASDRLAHALLERLAEWHSTAIASEDCPLPTLYRRLYAEGFEPTIGLFHDCLRKLHDEDLVYLHPWTAPLYAMPEPPFALLIGHEIAYYASRR